MSNPGKRGTSLASALSKASRKPADAVEEIIPQAEPAPASPQKALKVISTYLTPEDHKRIRDLSYHSEISIQQLGLQAWNMLLESKGHAPLAPTTAARPSGRNRS